VCRWKSRAKFERATVKLGSLLTGFIVPGRFARGFGLLKSKFSLIGCAQQSHPNLAALSCRQRHRDFLETRRAHAQSVTSRRNLDLG
jgi:hypothetical protein